MHRNVLPSPSNAGRFLKVNAAKPPKPGAAGSKGGGNRAVWEDEEWIREHGVQGVVANAVGTEGGASAAMEQ